MRWKQFFTPVKSIDTDQARVLMGEKPGQEMNILDVRQPNEYEASHIPGAKLIPLPDLGDRLFELDPQKPTLIY